MSVKPKDTPRMATEDKFPEAAPQTFSGRPKVVGPLRDFAGTYSNFAEVSQSPNDFVIDFAVLSGSADRSLIEEWGPKGVYPAMQVARVRIPFSLAEGLSQALAIQYEKYKTGEVIRQVDQSGSEDIDR